MPSFKSATLRLTMWYMLILVVLCALFSIIVYSIANRELHRPQKPYAQSIMRGVSIDEFIAQREIEAAESSRRLVGNLLIFNITALAAGGLCSYLLAKRTLQPIETALDAQMRFSSDAAHELRTPLSVMQSEIEIELRSKKSNKTSHQATLESNLDEVHRMRALTDRLLLLASDAELSLTRTQLEEVAIDAVNYVIPLAQSKNITIDNSVGNSHAIANQESLTDVVTILLDNAIKYSPTGGKIQLSSTEKPKYVVLTVKDHGIGIAPAEQAKVFDRFYRSDISRSNENVPGHGLGLSIASRIMQAHNGKITLESTPGKGSSFSLHIPR